MKRIGFVGGIRGMAELRRVGLIRPGRRSLCSASDLIEEPMLVADANEIMPPKSTWFGMFEPSLSDQVFLIVLFLHHTPHLKFLAYPI